jgi:hypothetical protein
MKNRILLCLGAVVIATATLSTVKAQGLAREWNPVYDETVIQYVRTLRNTTRTLPISDQYTIYKYQCTQAQTIRRTYRKSFDRWVSAPQHSVQQQKAWWVCNDYSVIRARYNYRTVNGTLPNSVKFYPLPN